MINRLLLSLSILIILGFHSQGLAQETEDPVTALLKASNSYQRQRPSEKVYLHTARAAYKDSERIWFAVYAVTGPTNRGSRISSRAKVQLRSPENVLISERDVLLIKGTGSDFFEIDKNLSPGKYTIQASTEWLENFGEEYHFKRTIEIGNAKKSASLTEPIRCDDTFLKLHLTENDLIAGLDQQISIETNQSNKLLHLYNKEGEQLKTINVENGWSLFELNPETGSGYYLRFEGCDKQFPLPEPKAQGIVMQVKAVGGKYQLVNITSNDPAYQDHTFSGIVRSRGWISTRANLQMKNGKARALIENSSLKQGISQISIIDAKGKAVSQRLIYRPLSKPYNVTSQAERKGDKIALTLNLIDENNESLEGKFSMKVTTSPDSTHESLQQFLFVNSELKRKANDQSSMNAWLPVTQWIGPSWEKIRQKELPATQKPLQSYIESSFSDIDGYILDPNVRTVEGVTVTDNRLPEDEDPLKQVTGRGDDTIDFDDLGITDGESVLSALKGRVAGVNVFGNFLQSPANPPVIRVRGVAAGIGDTLKGARIFLDQVIELSAEELDMIPAVEIGSVEIFKGPSAARWGTRGGSGVIALYSRKNTKKRAREKPKKKIPLPKQEAFDSEKTVKNANGLLHWEPDLQTNEQGEITFSFKATPGTGNTLYLRIEGLTSKGIPISQIVPVNIGP